MGKQAFFLILLVSNLAFSIEPEVSPEATLRVMTYNIRRKGEEDNDERQWANRLPQVKKQIEQIKPTIMGLQEATKEQIEDLLKELPYMQQFGEGRGSSWWGFGTNEYTPLFYDPNAVDLIDYGTFFINKSSSPVGWMPWEAGKTGWLPRIATWGKFKNKRTGKEFYIYNTHLDHMYEQAQISGLRTIKKTIDQASHDPVILIGDFNTEFLGNIKDAVPSFVHAREIAQQKGGPEATRTGWTDDELKMIDHILINEPGRFEVRNYSVIKQEKPYSSDHRPVFADLVIK